MNRDELLTRLATELAKWPHTDTVEKFHGHEFVYDFMGEIICLVDPDWDEVVSKKDYLQRRAELINRPSWDDAPEWAQWLAQCEDGEWLWYAGKPANGISGWVSLDTGHKTMKSAISGTIPTGHDWRETLENRPARIKTCRHCDMSFQRPSVAGIPDDRCERCHDEITAMRWDEGRADAIGQNGPTGDHYDEDSDIDSPLSRAMRELNPATSSLTHSQAEDAARETGICSDGSPCGSPHNPDDDQYCIGCPNELGEIAHDCPRCGGEWWSPPHSYCPCEDAPDAAPVTADDILESARKHMQDRAATYDKPEGERSMNSTVLAFAAITGIGMTEEQGWLFMQLLKAVRSQQGAYRADSYEDGAAYVALAGEAAAKERL